MTTLERVSERLADRGLQLVTAESCTGGMVAARFVDRPGASRFFHAGLVTYSDEAKQELLGVRPETLAAHGAVSEAVALEMARGAGRRGDVAVSITGIAGPGGGTPEKPVGTVWIAVATPEGERVERHRFPGDRRAIRDATVDAALDLLDRSLGDGP